MANPKRDASRLRAWRKIVSAKPETEREDVAAGRNAELALRSMVASHLTWKKASIFHSKRVPRTSGKGRHEIDLIVLTPKQISAIEIKNWSGRLRIDRGQWVQERRNGDDIAHENPLTKNRKKLDLVCKYLASHNIQVPNAKISRVLFWNRNLSVPSEMANRDDIVMHHQLDRFLSTQRATGLGERLLISVLELCLDQETSRIATDGFFEAIPSRDFAAADRAIKTFETFDKIELWGGRVISGDLLELRAGQERHRLKPLSSGDEIRVVCTRNKTLLFLSALFGASPLISLSPPFHSVPVTPDAKVLFHRAGQPQPEDIELTRIVRMIRG